MNKYYDKQEVLEKIEKEGVGNDLINLAIKYNTSKLYDPECFGYFKHYWNHLKEIRNNKIKLLEIGVKEGQSLLMWKEFFPNAEIFGIDIDEKCRNISQDRISIRIGDQSDIIFLETLNEKFDVIIDDGGHTMLQQQISFQYLFPKMLNTNGIYIIEDLGTSYWEKWGGGYKKYETTIGYIKKLIDCIGYRFYKGNRKDYVGMPEYKTINAHYLEENIESINLCRGICFIRKNNNFSI